MSLNSSPLVSSFEGIVLKCVHFRSQGSQQSYQAGLGR